MRSVNRRFVALLSCASIVAAGLAAPMMHVHDDADHINGHHAGRLIHSHTHMHGGVARQSSHGTALEDLGDDGEEARAIDPFQMVVGWAHLSAGLPPEIVSPPQPGVRAVTVRLLVQHSHDPPLTRTRPSRAPPALLS
jgi:hypothetical protein